MSTFEVFEELLRTIVTDKTQAWDASPLSRAPHLGPWASGFGVVNSLERRFSLLLAKKVDIVLPSIK